MSEILKTFTERNTDRTTWWVILDCGHWYHWTGEAAPNKAGDFPCPSCTPEPTIVPFPAPSVLVQQAQTWQPISSAPKDADVLLLYLDGSGVQPGWWETDGQRWIAVETQSLTYGGWHSEPTHWMPLPAPPAGDAK